jgi:hypothetical protein
MSCDHCKKKIEKGDSYSVTEYGRLHAGCLRGVAFNRVVLGRSCPDKPGGVFSGELDPIYVRWRAEARA